MARIGRPSIFPGKDYAHPRKIRMTPEGAAQMNLARTRLANLVGWKVVDVSDSDVVEFLARGEAKSIAYLERTGQIK